MQTIEAVSRSGVGIRRNETIRDAALAMERTGVGALVVLDGNDPVGIVTDRDLVRRGLAADLPASSRVDEVMSTPLVSVPSDADLDEAFATFRSHELRRLAVLQGRHFAGMLSLDDLLLDVTRRLVDLTMPVAHEVSRVEDAASNLTH